jgi:hypothetical protein
MSTCKIIFNNTFRLIFLLVIFICTTFAQTYNKQEFSSRERQINALQQLQNYNQRIIREETNLKKQAIPNTKVGIKVDKVLAKTSHIIFYDNIENGINGWTTTAYSNDDVWHQTSINFSSPSTSWWAGVEQQNNYNTGSRVNCAVISPPINLSGKIAPIKLLFTENYVTENGWDFCMVDVTTDGGITWDRLRGGYGTAPSGDSYGWIISTLDLSAYAEKTIQIRFYLDTYDNLYNDFPGWFVDDVLLFDAGGLVTGKKFFDVNNNSIKDVGERGIKDWFITANGEEISLTTRTNYRGRYWLPLPLGTYNVTETQQAGWTPTFPISGNWDITLATPDTLVDSIHFGNYTHASFINGKKFHDLDKSGSFTSGDTLLPEWKIILADTSGNEIDFDRTDSLGYYQLYIFEPGRYVVKEYSKQGWVQSSPPEEEYTIDIPDLFTTVNDIDFGNYYDPTVNGIIGQKFNDRNKNNIKDEGEEGLAGFSIRLLKQGPGGNFNNYKKRITDSTGYYQFLNIPEGTYKVYEIPSIGWYQSHPESCYIVTLPGGPFDTLDFGNYEINQGSIGGIKFNDLNANGIKDDGENGLSGWTFTLDGISIYGTSILNSATSDQDGNYVFDNVWPGTYQINEVFREDWRQTYPENLQGHFITLGPEQSLTDLNFGNVYDTTFNLSFRTFVPESLALAVDQKKKHLPIKNKPDKTEFTITLHNDTSITAHSLIFHTTKSIDTSTLVISKPATFEVLDKAFKKFKIIFNTLVEPGDSVTIHGYSWKIGIQHASTQRWLLSGGGFYIGHHETFINYVRLPMPNAINFLSAGAGTKLKVGIGLTHTVLHPSYKEVMKSLVEKNDRMHSGEPRCLGTYATNPNKLIKNQIKYLTPTKGNNKLFAAAIALQANINGSDYGILPVGFGNLIFDEGTGIDAEHPFNGKKVRDIGALLDSYMSGFDDVNKIPAPPPELVGFDSTEIYRIICLINSSFSGKIDTIRFGSSLKLKPVRPLADVPYLHLDGSFLSMNSNPIKQIPEQMPDVFELYQNYPNPFNPSTLIEFSLPRTSIVTLKLYNILGEEVATLLNKEEMEDGYQQVELSSNELNLASGIYIYRIVAETVKDEDNPLGNKYVSVKKMVLLK